MARRCLSEAPRRTSIGGGRRGGAATRRASRARRAAYWAREDPPRPDLGSADDPAPPREGTTVTYVITQACVDVLDKACIDECPVDCIYEGDRMLYIHPDECVDCGACEPV